MNRNQLLLVIGAFAVVGLLIAASIVWEEPSEEEGVRVVATFYPLAYLAESIGGERVSVDSLVPYNAELHSWSPSPQDIIAADDAELILYNGGPADAWLLDEIVPVIDSEGKSIVNTTVGVSYIHGGDHDHEDDHQEGGVDPHTWLSPREALVQARNVLNALIAVDPEGAEYFELRFVSVNQTLSQLDAQYRLLEGGEFDGIIISHAAFGYVASDYGFEQFGVIGMSADEEPSAQTIANLIEVMQERGIYSVFVDPVYRQDYVDILRSEQALEGYEVQVLDLFLMLGPYDGMDYLDQMSANLVNLKAGLGVD